MRTTFLLTSLLSTSLFAQLAPRQTATLYQHMVEVNEEWRTMDPLLENGDRTIQFASEAERIAMHLHLVRETLEERTPEGLSADQLAVRLDLLDDLDRYADRGLFPQNDILPYRNPVFIDRYNTACAVGQLMIESGDTRLAERISSEMNLSYVHDMSWPEIGAWAVDHGFTADELAWIQPGYPPGIPWSGLGGGTDGAVTALFNRSNGNLIVAGEFTMAGTTPATQVAEWLGSAYQSLGAGVSGYVTCGVEFNGLLYLGGAPFNAGYQDVAVWNGVAWSYQNAFNGKYAQVNDLHVFNGDLYAAGFAGGFAGNTHQVLRLDAGSWLPVGGSLGTSFNDEVLALDELGGNLVCGGRFTQLGMFGGPALPHVAFIYGSSDWFQMGDGLDATVRDLHNYNGHLYACGDFRVDNVPTFGFARITAGAPSWEQLLPYQTSYLHYLNGEAYFNSMTTAGGELYIAGAFDIGGMWGTYGQSVAHFWGLPDALAAMALVNARVNKIAPFNNLLVIGGDFTMNDALPLPYLAYTELTTSIPQLGTGVGIDVVPNPAEDEVALTMDRTPGPGTTVEVLDAAGRSVIAAVPVSAHEVILDVRALSSGSYMLRLNDALGPRTVSFVKR